MPRKTFVAGEVLAAADVNEFLADQAVMTFAGTAARGSAISVPVEGMVTYLEDDDQLEVYGGTAVGWSSASNFIFGTAVPTDGQVASYSTAVSGWVPADASSGKILQVVSTTKTDTFTTTSTSFVDVTGASASITPSSTSSKILIIVSGLLANSTSTNVNRINLMRGATAIAQSTGSAVENQTLAAYPALVATGESFSITFLDSPATTSSVTYSLKTAVTGGTGYIGRVGDSDNRRTITTITLMEVAG